MRLILSLISLSFFLFGQGIISNILQNHLMFNCGSLLAAKLVPTMFSLGYLFFAFFLPEIIRILGEFRSYLISLSTLSLLLILNHLIKNSFLSLITSLFSGIFCLLSLHCLLSDFRMIEGENNNSILLYNIFNNIKYLSSIFLYISSNLFLIISSFWILSLISYILRGEIKTDHPVLWLNMKFKDFTERYNNYFIDIVAISSTNALLEGCIFIILRDLFSRKESSSYFLIYKTGITLAYLIYSYYHNKGINTEDLIIKLSFFAISVNVLLLLSTFISPKTIKYFIFFLGSSISLLMVLINNRIVRRLRADGYPRPVAISLVQKIDKTIGVICPLLVILIPHKYLYFVPPLSASIFLLRFIYPYENLIFLNNKS